MTTADISAQLPNIKNKFFDFKSNIWTKVPPTPTVGPEQINWTYDQVEIDKTSESFSQTLGQDQSNTRPKTVFTPQYTTFIRDEIDYSKSYHVVKGEEISINGNLKKDIDLSEHISKTLRRMTMLERKPRNNREGSCSGSSNYVALTSSSIKDRHLNQRQQICHFIDRAGNQSYNNKEMLETSSDQLPKKGHENMTRVTSRFYRQITYDEQLQAYVFTDALIPAETSMYNIFHETTKRIFRYNPEIGKFRQVKVEECDSTTRYMLCQHVIFHQMTSQTNYEMDKCQTNKSMTYGSKLQTMTE